MATTTHRRKRHLESIIYGWHKRPIVPATVICKGRRYSRDDKCDIVEMIDEGWSALDVAVAYDVGVYLHKTHGGYRSTIYNNYIVWKAWYDAHGHEYRRSQRFKEDQKTPS